MDPVDRPASAARVAATAAQAARGVGVSVLGELEILPALAALGWSPPHTSVLEGAPGSFDLDAYPGRRVVLKLSSPAVPHRTEVGGVLVVERSRDAVAEAARKLLERSPDPRARILVQELVEHDASPGAELLLGARWTEDFGVVVTLGLGGVAAEALGRMAGPGATTLLAHAELTAAGIVRARLEAGELGALATGSLRGQRGRVSADELASWVDAFTRFAEATIPGTFSEVEINPLVVRAGRPVPLDVLARLSDGEGPGGGVGALPAARKEGIARLLAPRSVAVVGVSSRMNPGRAILRNVLAAGFDPADVQVVKPGSAGVGGCRCVPDVASLDPAVDLLVVSVAAADVPALMEDVVRLGRARSVILIPGGLGEGAVEGEGRRRVDAIRALLDRAGAGAPVVNGGNCLGVRSVPGRCDTLFIPSAKLGFPAGVPHPVAVVSQSGAFAIARASALPWLNPTYVVTVGNQVDLTVGEYVEALADDPGIRVVACYVEGFRPLDGVRLLRAARRLADEGRALILYRAGRTRRGAQAAVSHTASLAGDYAVTRALAEEAGALVAESLDDFDDLLTVAVLLADRRVAGDGAAVLSNAGFECVALADAAGPLRLPAPSATTVERIGSVLRAHHLEEIVSGAGNPLDLTPIVGDEGFVAAARALLADVGVDVGVVGCVPLTPALRTLGPGNDMGEELEDPEGMLVGLRRLWQETDKAWVCVVDGGPRYDALAGGLTEAGIPTFRRADRGARALGRYVAWRTSGRRRAPSGESAVQTGHDPVEAPVHVLGHAESAGGLEGHESVE